MRILTMDQMRPTTLSEIELDALRQIARILSPAISLSYPIPADGYGYTKEGRWGIVRTDDGLHRMATANDQKSAGSYGRRALSCGAFDDSTCPPARQGGPPFAAQYPLLTADA